MDFNMRDKRRKHAFSELKAHPQSMGVGFSKESHIEVFLIASNKIWWV